MKYYFYLDNVLMPVTPSGLCLRQDGKSNRYDLAAGGEISLPQTPGLREYSFSLMLPTVPYPFAMYPGGFRSPEFYLRRLQSLRENAAPFDLVIIRRLNADTVLRFASRLIGYDSEEAYQITGSEQGVITAAHARTILREGVSGKAAVLFDTTDRVTIEEMTVKEDAEDYGDDFHVDLTLRQYREFKPIRLKSGGNNVYRT